MVGVAVLAARTCDCCRVEDNHTEMQERTGVISNGLLSGTGPEEQIRVWGRGRSAVKLDTTATRAMAIAASGCGRNHAFFLSTGVEPSPYLQEGQ